MTSPKKAVEKNAHCNVIFREIFSFGETKRCTHEKTHQPNGKNKEKTERACVETGQKEKII